MICPHILIQFGPLVGKNVCGRCGEVDDPVCVQNWTQDDDLDPICDQCIEKGEPLGTPNAVLDPPNNLHFARLAFANARTLLKAAKTPKDTKDAEELLKRAMVRLGLANARIKFGQEST